MVFISWSKILETKWKEAACVHNLLGLTFLSSVTLVEPTLTVGVRESIFFTGWVMKGVEMIERLLAESPWMGWAWDGPAQSHLSLLGPLLTLEKMSSLTCVVSQCGLHLGNRWEKERSEQWLYKQEARSQHSVSSISDCQVRAILVRSC